MSDPFLFLTGPYRTGSTYTALLMNNHPEVTVGLHTTNTPRWVDAVEDEAFLEVIWRHAHERWDVKMPSLGRVAGMMDSKGPAGAWRAVLESYGRHRDFYRTETSTVVGEKTNLDTDFVPTFLDWYPDSGKALAVLRDPRSVTASFREYTYHDPPAYLQAPFVCLKAMQNVRWYREAYEPDRFRFVRYEDIARRPALVTSDLTRWLDLEWPGAERMLDTSEWSEVPGSRWEDRSSFADADDIDVDRAVNRWRYSLSAMEQAFVEEVCRGEMERFGYEPEADFRASYRDLQWMVRNRCENERQRGRTLTVLDHWHKTGEGTEEFPDADVTDPETWTEQQEEKR